MTPHDAQNKRDIAVEVATVDQLFNAPSVDPFSDRDAEILGYSGLAYLVRQLHAHRRDWQHLRVIIRLPPDQIAPGSESRLIEAVRRYCRAKIADNALEVRLIRRRSGVALGILAGIVVAIIALAYFLFTGALSGAPIAAQYLVAGIISLFAWVTLWDVLEAFIFNPIPLARENSALRRIADLEIVVEPDRTHHRLFDTEQMFPSERVART